MHFKPLIELDRATVRRSGADLIADMCFVLPRGEHVAVLGRNGAGKSTFIKLLRGDLPPTSGTRTYRVNGSRQFTPIGLRHRFGLVSAEMHDRYAASHWHQSAAQAVAAAVDDQLLLYGEAGERVERARALLRALGAGSFADQPVSGLSTGQTRLMVLARALFVEPVALFLDEPLEGLDRAARTMLLAALERAGDMAQLVCAAHCPEDLPGCVRRAALLEGGRLVRCGAVEDVWGSVADDGGAVAPDVSALACDLPEPGYSFVFRVANGAAVKAGKRILDSIDWTVRPGENWVLAGDNGGGKSTLLRALIGLDDFYAGTELEWFGEPGWPEMAEVRRRVGFVSAEFQARYAYDLSVEELVWSGFFGHEGRHADPTGEQRVRAVEAMAFFGVDGLRDQPIRTLSSGQARRAFLARAVAPGPEMLLLDEPLSGLDGPARTAARMLVDTLLAQGMPVVYVTHRPEDLPEDMTHLLVLSQGRVQWQGRLTEYGG